ncbi:hypothetical protein LRD69_18875 [Streptomyces sp. JH14]|uniref:hypothetical protein n=1 Tax=Streptomyces sp. JH14 TaxID=2793630 RepID=UPI0023F758E9|nr:hypothetical protein [Streptomyces sp. JH14]MDF6044163.1 hypothetical protein [Streptomyces sp. JH14]
MSSGRAPYDSAQENARENELLLIRSAMAEAAEGAPPLPDLVPVALVQGRRRRARARVAVGTGVAAVLALGTFGATLPSWGTGSVAGQVGAAPGAPDGTAMPTPVPTGPSRTPVHVEPTPGESSMAGLPAAERRRQEQFQQQAAALLDTLLPAGFGTVRPVDLAVSRYQGGSNGRVFPVVFSVRPTGGSADAPGEAPCRDNPKKMFQCKEAKLPDGRVARVVSAAGNQKDGRTIVGVSLRFVYGDSTVLLSADGDDSAMVSAPVTADQLLGVAGDSRFLALVRYAETFPMEPKQESVRGG